jgi:hypothetical protein
MEDWANRVTCIKKLHHYHCPISLHILVIVGEHRMTQYLTTLFHQENHTVFKIVIWLVGQFDSQTSKSLYDKAVQL